MSNRHPKISSYKLFKCGRPLLRTPVIHYIILAGYLKYSYPSDFCLPQLCSAKPGEAETSVPASPLDSLTA